jgi:hypothetical protein
MAGTIKNVQISGYDTGVTYEKYDVVSAQTGIYPIYFVSISGAAQGNVNQLDNVAYLSNDFWKRFDDPAWKFSDVWKPAYQTALNVDIKPKLSPYGDGYAQKVDTSIFFNKLGYEVSFDVLDNRELKSLVSYFEYKGGTDYILTDIPPFITNRRFVGKNWKHTYSSDNINNFSVSMFEFIAE